MGRTHHADLTRGRGGLMLTANRDQLRKQATPACGFFLKSTAHARNVPVKSAAPAMPNT